MTTTDEIAPSVVAQPNWAEQDDLLRSLWHEGKTPEDIGEKLGRSVAAIMTRAARLGLPRRAAPGRKRGYKREAMPRQEKKVRVRIRRSYAEEEAEEKVASEACMRICLMCLNKFQSEGKHNRICPACKGSADYMTGSSTPDFTFEIST